MSDGGNGTGTANTAVTALVERAPVNAGKRGLELRSLDDMYRFAKYVSASGLAPKGMERPESILVALQMGAEVGLTPMAALQNIAVVNGRPSIWGDAMLAVCQASGHFDHAAFDEEVVGEGPNMTATCTVRRLPNGKPTTRSFSLGDAKAAGLAGKAGPWSQYPRRMLQMRARSWALRDAFPDVLRGFKSTEDQDYIDAESRPLPEPVSNLGELTGRLTQRLSQTAMTAEPADDDELAGDLPAGPVEAPPAKRRSAKPVIDPNQLPPESGDDPADALDPLARWKAEKRSKYEMAAVRAEMLKRLYDADCGPESTLTDEQREFCTDLYRQLAAAPEGHYAGGE